MADGEAWQTTKQRQPAPSSRSSSSVSMTALPLPSSLLAAVTEWTATDSPFGSTIGVLSPDAPSGSMGPAAAAATRAARLAARIPHATRSY